MSDIALDTLPGIPRDADGPSFAEPWEAQAFALVVALHARGHFTWEKWAATLAEEIKRAQRLGDPDRGDTYYRHWLAALERIVVEQALTDHASLAVMRENWDRAARATPHGRPIVLGERERHAP
jgi:nitrile hydratase accessory protein